MKKLSVFILVLILFSITAYANRTVVYPNLYGLEEKAFAYDVLKLALSKSGKDYKVKLTENNLNTTRAIRELSAGRVTVFDGGPSKGIESEFDVIYIPIDMGLIGWRIFIINEDLQDDFHKIKTLDDLTHKKAGQGNGWPDISILENAGIKVDTNFKFEILFNMLEGKRIDFLPLGVNEAHGFLKQLGKNRTKLVIEDSVVLVYPFGRFFFIKKGDEELKNDIISGLEKSFSDGSFPKLVLNHPFFKEGLEKANLKNRTIIRIDNPFLPESFYKIDPKWWYKFK